MSPLLFLILIIFLLIWLRFYQCCYVAETALVLFIFTVALYFLSMCFALCPTFIILSELLTWSEFAFAFLFAKVEAEAMNLCLTSCSGQALTAMNFPLTDSYVFAVIQVRHVPFSCWFLLGPTGYLRLHIWVWKILRGLSR